MTSSAVSTAARVASEMPGFPLRTRLTVASLTPACFATSASLPATPQDYCKILRKPDARTAGPAVRADVRRSERFQASGEPSSALTSIRAAVFAYLLARPFSGWRARASTPLFFLDGCVLRLAVVGNCGDEFVTAAHACHRRPEAWEEIHERL